MRRRALLGAVGAIIVGSGVFAAVGLGGSDDKVATGPPVAKEIERVSAADARASGASAPLARARAKKPRLNYFLADTPTIVPPYPAFTPITVLTCPAGQKVVSGYFQTDRLVAADHFSAAPPRQWEYGFIDAGRGDGGSALEGIVCAKGVK